MPAPTRARRAPKTAKPTRPLACHVCGESAQGMLRIESDTDYAQRAGRRRVTATVICEECGNRWQSVHPTAVAVARDLAKAGAGARG